MNKYIGNFNKLKDYGFREEVICYTKKTNFLMIGSGLDHTRTKRLQDDYCDEILIDKQTRLVEWNELHLYYDDIPNIENYIQDLIKDGLVIRRRRNEIYSNENKRL